MSHTSDRGIDYEIEQFWLQFKCSIINFYEKNNNLLTRPINKWSNHLNILQSKNDYSSIERYILKYISLYAIDLMRIHDNYSINILVTNIKRWDKISLKYKIFSDKDKACNLIFVLLDIYNLLMVKDKLDETLYDDIELFYFFHDFRTLIEYARDQKTPSILDKLINYDKDIFSQIIEVYNLNNNIIKSPISGRKLFKLINIH
jgi:hypothetical protein